MDHKTAHMLELNGFTRTTTSNEKYVMRNVVLGSGSFGDVCLGFRHNGAGAWTEVAIKRVRLQSPKKAPPLACSVYHDGGMQWTAVSVVREACIARSLQGAAGVRTYSPWFTTADSTVYIPMERMDASLATYASRCLHFQFPKGQLTHLCAQCLRSLVLLHDSGFVHRDLKPENFLVLLEERWDSTSHSKGAADPRERERRRQTGYGAVQVKLADFGLSANMHDAEACGDLVGTYIYMAPECLAQFVTVSPEGGQPPHAQQQVPPRPTMDELVSRDVWSLGCVFYYLLTGTHAFDGAPTKEETLRRVRRGPPSLATVHLRQRTTETTLLYQLVLFMLAPLSAQRPSAWQTLARLLESTERERRVGAAAGLPPDFVAHFRHVLPHPPPSATSAASPFALSRHPRLLQALYVCRPDAQLLVYSQPTTAATAHSPCPFTLRLGFMVLLEEAVEGELLPGCGDDSGRWSIHAGSSPPPTLEATPVAPTHAATLLRLPNCYDRVEASPEPTPLFVGSPLSATAATVLSFAHPLSRLHTSPGAPPAPQAWLKIAYPVSGFVPRYQDGAHLFHAYEDRHRLPCPPLSSRVASPSTPPLGLAVPTRSSSRTLDRLPSGAVQRELFLSCEDDDDNTAGPQTIRGHRQQQQPLRRQPSGGAATPCLPSPQTHVPSPPSREPVTLYTASYHPGEDEASSSINRPYHLQPPPQPLPLQPPRQPIPVLRLAPTPPASPHTLLRPLEGGGPRTTTAATTNQHYDNHNPNNRAHLVHPSPPPQPQPQQQLQQHRATLRPTTDTTTGHGTAARGNTGTLTEAQAKNAVETDTSNNKNKGLGAAKKIRNAFRQLFSG